MEINITLSKKEKRHYFLYLIGMLLFAVLILSVISLSRIRSPFSKDLDYAVGELKGKVNFERELISYQKQVDSTFKKLEKLDPEKSSISEENQLDREISNMGMSFLNSESKDARKRSFHQISEFYRIYFEDKKSLKDIKDNVKYLDELLKDCKVSYDGKKQLLNQKRGY